MGCKYYIVQQNSCNLTSNNSEIVIIWHLRRAVPRPKVLLFTRKQSFINETDLGGMLKKASKSVCTSNIVLSPDPVSPTPSTSSTMKTPENTDKDSSDTEPAD
jgi:hypothetical protein